MIIIEILTIGDTIPVIKRIISSREIIYFGKLLVGRSRRKGIFQVGCKIVADAGGYVHAFDNRISDIQVCTQVPRAIIIRRLQGRDDSAASLEKGRAWQ